MSATSSPGSPPPSWPRRSTRGRCRPSRSRRPTWTASPRSTAQVHAFLHVADGGRAGVGRAGRRERWPRAPRPRRRWPGCRWRSRTSSPPIDMPTTAGSKILEGWRPPYDATVDRAAARGRDHHPGQDQHGRVRHGLVHRELGVRPHPQPVGPRPHPRRLRRRLGGGAGRVRGAAGHRHRHRRLDPPARRGHRHGRGEAHLRRGVALRADRLRVVAGPGRPVRAHRARRRAAARGDRRVRPARLHLDRRARARPSSPRPATGRRGDLSGLRVGVVRELGGEGYQPGVRASFDAGASAQLEKLGAELVEVELPALRVRAGRLLPDPAQRGVVQPRPVRRDALRPARADGGRRRRRRSWPPPARPGSAPRSSGASSSAPTRCRRATTTPTTGRRRRCAR